MLAKIKAGLNPGEPSYLTEQEFVTMLSRRPNREGAQVTYKDDEAVHWTSVARIGSRFQIGTNMYIKVLELGDDPFIYYTPEAPPIIQDSGSWTGSRVPGGRISSSCGDSCGNSCKSGCGGHKP